MSAVNKPSLPAEALDERDDLPGVEGFLVLAANVAALLAFLSLMG